MIAKMIQIDKSRRMAKNISADALALAFKNEAARGEFFDLIDVIPAETVQKAIGNKDALVEAALNHNAAFAHFKWVPEHFFIKQENIAKLFETFKASEPENPQIFFTLFTPKQFTLLAKKYEFHSGELTASALNALVGEKVDHKVQKAYLKELPNLKMAFFNSLYKNKEAESEIPLDKKIAQKLPKEYLKKIDFMPHPKDLEYINEAQAMEAGDLVKGINFKEAPKKAIRALQGKKAVSRVIKTAAGKDDVAKDEKTLSNFTAAQWNTFLMKAEHCQYLKTTKIDNVSKITFSPACFANLDANVQSHILVKHTNLPDKILSKVNKEMANAWEYKDASGLEVLAHIVSKNKDAIIANLGASSLIADDKHPLAGMSLEDVAQIKVLAANISAKAVSVLEIGDIDKIVLKEHAAILAKSEGIFEKIEAMNADIDEEDKDAAKKNVWVKMSKDVFAKLTVPGSTIAADMTKEVFDILPADKRTEMKGHFVAQLDFLKDLSKADYATLCETAFDGITKANVAAVRIADMTDAQLANLSVAVADVAESAFAGVTPAEMALPVERVALLKARQWAPLAPAAFKAAVATKEAMVAVPAAATATWTAAQLKELPKEAVAAITAEQIELMGSEVADAKLSATAFLLANKAMLASETAAALAKRFPEASSGAAALSVSAAAIAAVAVLAFLA
jgi:hypothetical protein